MNLILLASLLVSPIVAQQPGETTHETQVSMLINFHQSPGASELEWVENSIGGSITHQYQSIPAIAALIPQSNLEMLESHPSIDFVEEDGEAFLYDIDNTWGVKQIGGEFAHNLGQFGAGIKVGVIDTGCDYNHPELSAIYKGGYDFVQNDNNPMDDHTQSHGTHVSGTIGAAMDGTGVVGVAPQVDLYAVKGFNAFGSGQISDLIACVDWTTTNQMDVVNNSWGSFSPGATLKSAFEASLAAGVIHVCAAGNYGGFFGVLAPAKWDTTIAVSATSSNNNIAGFSDRGPEIDFAAPGVDVYSTSRGGNYIYLSGTSMASPHVAGTVAAVLGTGTIDDDDNDGNLFNETRARLAAAAIDLGNVGKDDLYGFGLVNVHGSLFEPIEMTPSNLIAGQTGTVTFSGCTPNDTVYLCGSFMGTSYQRLDNLGVLMGVAPNVIGMTIADGQGNATLNTGIPGNLSGTQMVLQAVEYTSNTSSVAKVLIQ